MTELYVRYLDSKNALIPADQASMDELGLIRGGVYRCKLSTPRNLGFHRKFFAMIKVGFDAWDPGDSGVASKSIDVFRKELLILAGYYRQVFRIDGRFTLEARSISFGSMSQQEFEMAYSAVADVLLQRVLAGYSRDDLDDQVDRILSFT